MKKSFSMAEVVFSLVLLSVSLAALINLFEKDDSYEIYSSLVEIQNGYSLNGDVENNKNINFK